MGKCPQKVFTSSPVSVFQSFNFLSRESQTVKLSSEQMEQRTKQECLSDVPLPRTMPTNKQIS